ncbi:MAG TPA: hypothetical protein VFX16_15210 [Pseudonocardiaceae bacterium]|nr:hypothetical protein [Pseudonocardiaceae bacterium]
MIANLIQEADRHRALLLTGCVVVAVLLLLLLARPVMRLVRRLPAGTPWYYYLASAGGLAVSLNTSWRFFGARLGVTGAERVVMFSVVELALVACALGMRANVRRLDLATGRAGGPGAPRTVAWVLCGLSAYAALLLSGPIDGVARVALGPLLSLVMLHLALGIEIRNRTATHTGVWARVAGEMRERVLSRLGLADDDRDALTRTRERAARRVALLALSRRTPLRTARLSRALRTSNVAHDDRIQRRMLAELAVLKHADELATLALPSPWTSIPQPTEPARPTEPRRVAATPTTPVVAEEKRPEPAPPVEPAPRASVPERRRRPEREDTYTTGMLDSVLLAAHTSPEWASETSPAAAIDLADELLPDRKPTEIVAALGQIGVTVSESSVRHRRNQRSDNVEQMDQAS